MLVASDWEEYKIIDASNKEKIETWSGVTLLRPSPEVIWDDRELYYEYKESIDAVYNRSNSGGGSWNNLKDVPDRWIINYKNLKFNLKQMGFKHTGLFPEQAVNWDFMINKIQESSKKCKVLNLFGYTGAATVAALSAGASVVHVDSSKGMNEWCKENVALNSLESSDIRYLTDDVLKFVKREIRRGNKYDGIVMDPPSYGRGAGGEVWTFENNIKELIELTSELLSDDAIFYIVNSYSAGYSGIIIENLIKNNINIPGKITVNEIGLKVEKKDLILPCGVTTRWEK
ncbi:MAG: class I SAM-dependent methyltransferase [bacterium]